MIREVAPGSPADRAGLGAGDRIVAVQGHPVHDLLDYLYHADSLRIEVRVRPPSGGGDRPRLIERQEHEPAGLTFYPMKPRACRNRCIFCFIDQNPPGLRQSLYFKDEDYRFSFLHGNYVTLSDLGTEAAARIEAMRLSPLYISVHTTDRTLRDAMLGRRGAAPLLPLLARFKAAGIRIHTQVVLCPGVNDGEALRTTLYDLAELRPEISSIAVVPVGLTKHREGLHSIEPVTPDYSLKFIKEFEEISGILQGELHDPFIFLADEFYLSAGRPLPGSSCYGAFPQLENGVGMARLFLDEAESVSLSESGESGPLPEMTICTGTLAAPLAARFVDRVAVAYEARIKLLPVKNRLFGSSVSVTGLVSGRDIIDAFTKDGLGRAILLPDVMLRDEEDGFHEEEVLIDDMTLDDLKDHTGCRVEKFGSTPKGLIDTIGSMAGKR